MCDVWQVKILVGSSIFQGCQLKISIERTFLTNSLSLVKVFENEEKEVFICFSWGLSHLHQFWKRLKGRFALEGPPVVEGIVHMGEIGFGMDLQQGYWKQEEAWGWFWFPVYLFLMQKVRFSTHIVLALIHILHITKQLAKPLIALPHIYILRPAN